MTIEEAKAIRACNGKGYSTVEFIKALQLTEPNPPKDCSREGKKMITEDYVSFETAKLLKEKGFDWECRAFYVKSKECGIELFHAKEPYNYNNNVHPCTSAPTHQMAMKWLREKEIFAEVTHDIVPSPNYKYHYSVFRTEPEFYYSGDSYNSHEEACEAAIKYCLEKLI